MLKLFSRILFLICIIMLLVSIVPFFLKEQTFNWWVIFMSAAIFGILSDLLEN